MDTETNPFTGKPFFNEVNGYFVRLCFDGFVSHVGRGVCNEGILRRPLGWYLGCWVRSPRSQALWNRRYNSS